VNIIIKFDVLCTHSIRVFIVLMSMASVMSAKYASLYDTYVADDGKTYIAKLISGEMTWVLLPCGDKREPTIPATVMDVGDVLIGEDKKEYIVMMSKGNKIWSLKNKQPKQKAQSKFPVVPVEVLDVGDIQVADDGTEYIVKLVNGDKQYTLYQKSYKWSKTGVMYTTLDSGDYCPSSSKSKSKSSSHSKKMVKT
jgi:hypothetical protein